MILRIGWSRQSKTTIYTNKMHISFPWFNDKKHSLLGAILCLGDLEIFLGYKKYWKNPDSEPWSKSWVWVVTLLIWSCYLKFLKWRLSSHKNTSIFSMFYSHPHTFEANSREITQIQDWAIKMIHLIGIDNNYQILKHFLIIVFLKPFLFKFSLGSFMYSLLLKRHTVKV